LKELEKIELIRQPNGNYKLDHAVTAPPESNTRCLWIGRRMDQGTGKTDWKRHSERRNARRIERR
ncbi:hypothetical protein ACXO8C_09455, partial [Lactobacillus delbrueckii subsp. bulgaricus]